MTFRALRCFSTLFRLFLRRAANALLHLLHHGIRLQQVGLDLQFVGLVRFTRTLKFRQAQHDLNRGPLQLWPVPGLRLHHRLHGLSGHHHQLLRLNPARVLAGILAHLVDDLRVDVGRHQLAVIVRRVAPGGIGLERRTRTARGLLLREGRVVGVGVRAAADLRLLLRVDPVGSVAQVERHLGQNSFG